MSATTPESVGWVFIATPHKLAVAIKKIAVMTYTGAALLRKFTALPQLSETAHVTSQKTS